MDSERLAKLQKALEIAERVNNPYMAQNIRTAINELKDDSTYGPHRDSPG